MQGVSAIIPTFHRHEAVADLVCDLFAQTVLPAQVIVVDNSDPAARRPIVGLDGSGSTETLYLSSSGTGRANLARNEGLRAATGEYALLLDDDLSLPTDCISELLAVHAEGWDAVHGCVIQDGRPLEDRSPVGSAMWTLLRHRHGEGRGQTIAVSSGFVSLKMSVANAIGFLDEAFVYHYDDYDLGYRVWAQGFTLIHDPRPRATHRKLQSGGSRQHLTGRLGELNKYTAKYYFLSKHFPERAVRLEYLNDLLIALLEMRPRRAVRSVQTMSVIRRAYRDRCRYADWTSRAQLALEDRIAVSRAKC